MWYPSGSCSRGSRLGIGQDSDAANLARVPLGTLAQPCGSVSMLQLDSAWQMHIGSRLCQRLLSLLIHPHCVFFFLHILQFLFSPSLSYAEEPRTESVDWLTGAMFVEGIARLLPRTTTYPGGNEGYQTLYLRHAASKPRPRRGLGVATSSIDARNYFSISR